MNSCGRWEEQHACISTHFHSMTTVMAVHSAWHVERITVSSAYTRVHNFLLNMYVQPSHLGSLVGKNLSWECCGFQIRLSQFSFENGVHLVLLLLCCLAFIINDLQTLPIAKGVVIAITWKTFPFKAIHPCFISMATPEIGVTHFTFIGMYTQITRSVTT